MLGGAEQKSRAGRQTFQPRLTVAQKIAPEPERSSVRIVFYTYKRSISVNG